MRRAPRLAVGVRASRVIRLFHTKKTDKCDSKKQITKK